MIVECAAVVRELDAHVKTHELQSLLLVRSRPQRG
jgi:hypothetical protein